jgi:hypothetical protein
MVRQFQERRYHFASFPEAETLMRTGQPFVLMGHDIDLSLEAALRTARPGADLGGQATCFLKINRGLNNTITSTYHKPLVAELSEEGKEWRR